MRRHYRKRPIELNVRVPGTDWSDVVFWLLLGLAVLGGCFGGKERLDCGLGVAKACEAKS